MYKKYSRVYNYKYGEYTNKFRYNYGSMCLEYICKPSKTHINMIREDAESCKIKWMQEEAQRNLVSIENTGYAVLESYPLSPYNWEDNRDYYMDSASEDIACLLNEGV